MSLKWKCINAGDEHVKLETVQACLKQGGKVFFVIPRKYGEFFRNQLKRINRSEVMKVNNASLLDSVFYKFYLTYIFVLDELVSMRCPALGRALFVYHASWRYISTYDGELVEAGTQLKVTYNGKIVNP
ncbi:MAG: hypothetical protein D6160_11665 [Ketobacter sp.]|nr:MAG: hypothetical protein D6160_11665 [Ketobacter sp.]